jgi:hypothetical protein
MSTDYVNLKKIRNEVERIQENLYLNARALMLLEFQLQIEELSDELTAFLIEVAYEAYESAEYSTPTGVGMAMWHFLEDEENYEYILNIDFDEDGVFYKTSENFFLYYSNSDWR